MQVIGSDQLVHATIKSNGGTYHSGAIYWDGNGQKMKVIDANGHPQDMYGPTVEVSASGLLRDVVSWAHKKMAEEQELDNLCKEYPTLEDARREFEILKKLVGNNNAQ